MSSALAFAPASALRVVCEATAEESMTNQEPRMACRDLPRSVGGDRREEW